jgi:MinD-like ATPase involved in chromosome partitioning or flagellar assembly
MKFVTVVSVKGGLSKTTIVANLRVVPIWRTR